MRRKDRADTPEKKTGQRAPRQPHHPAANASAAGAAGHRHVSAALCPALQAADQAARRAQDARRAPADAAHDRGGEPRHHLRQKRRHPRPLLHGGERLRLASRRRQKRAGPRPDRKRPRRDPRRGPERHPRRYEGHRLAVQGHQEEGRAGDGGQSPRVYQRQRHQRRLSGTDLQALLPLFLARRARHRLCQRQRRRLRP